MVFLNGTVNSGSTNSNKLPGTLSVLALQGFGSDSYSKMDAVLAMCPRSMEVRGFETQHEIPGGEPNPVPRVVLGRLLVLTVGTGLLPADGAGDIVVGRLPDLLCPQEPIVYCGDISRVGIPETQGRLKAQNTLEWGESRG